jgi:hypothetical protein
MALVPLIAPVRLSSFIVVFLIVAVGCDRKIRTVAPKTSLVELPTTTLSGPPFFTEITDSSGVEFQHHVGPVGRYFFPDIMAGGAAFFDFNLDGKLDIYLVNSGSPPSQVDSVAMARLGANRLFQQQSDGRFVDVSQASGLGDTGYGMGVAIGDINNDGYPDVYVTNYGPDRLYLNGGDGVFTDITQAAGIENDRWSASAAFFDFDRDGWLDLFVTNYVDYQPFQPCRDAAGRLDYCNPAVFPRTSDVLYHNLSGNDPDQSGGSTEPDNAPIRFENVSLESGIAEKPGAGLGVFCADLNGDEWPDVYVSNDGHANHLWINQHNGEFRDEAILFGAAYDAVGRGQASMGLALGDVNDDGWLDLLSTHMEGESNALYLSSGGPIFSESSVRSRIAEASLPLTGFGAIFVDFEHDGDLDLAVVNGRVRRSLAGPKKSHTGDETLSRSYAERNQLLMNIGQGVFQEFAGADAFLGHVEVSRALAYGDVDNDGDVDLLVTNFVGQARLFRNDAPKKGHWLIARVVEPKLGGRDAYGAQLTVITAGKRIQGLVSPGSSYLASHDPRVHFGLGNAANVEHIEVRWPDGVNEVFPGGAADRFIVLARGEGTPP